MASARIRFERQRHRIAWRETAKALNDLAQHRNQNQKRKERKYEENPRKVNPHGRDAWNIPRRYKGL
jgi:hypothetical protein